ncbi:hypothetical protein U1769_02150 [Sphingomonas sp. ZT3P38]|uniref:hypothetical protein n=1 Tax=Parasphingomonas zepuensis TaxID=3096161 RepID=UPI002FCB102D
MGYLVSFAAIAGLKETTTLHRIPETIPWRAFRIENGLVLIDWLRRPNPNIKPAARPRIPATPEFAVRPSGVAFDSVFGDAAPGLDDLYKRLGKERRAGTLPAVAVHTALLLHGLTQCPVLSVMSNDDDWDFAREARDGALHQASFVSGEEDIHVDHDGVIEVLPISSESHAVHRIAQREAMLWFEKLQCLFGFDGTSEPLSLIEIDRSRQAEVSKTPPSSPARRPFWKLW